MIKVGNAINSSINQQKFTRRYFMYTVKNNSMIPLRNSLDPWMDEGHRVAGLYSFGFREKATNGGNFSFAPCYKISTFFTAGGDSGETCDEPEAGESTSNFIRVYNFYGLCGETYFAAGPGNYYSTYRYVPGLEAQMHSNTICTFGNGGS
jgi:hypothetical protein